MDNYRDQCEREAKEKGLREGKKEGIKEGIKEGEIKKQKEIAKELLEMNMTIEQISRATKLSEAEIEKLQI